VLSVVTADVTVQFQVSQSMKLVAHAQDISVHDGIDIADVTVIADVLVVFADEIKNLVQVQVQVSVEEVNHLI
jgi:hypothetical protein